MVDEAVELIEVVVGENEVSSDEVGSDEVGGVKASISKSPVPTEHKQLRQWSYGSKNQVANNIKFYQYFQIYYRNMYVRPILVSLHKPNIHINNWNSNSFQQLCVGS